MPHVKKKTRRRKTGRFVYFIIYLFLTQFYIIVILLPEKFHYSFSKPLAIIAYYTLSRTRRLIMGNLKTAYSEDMSYGERVRLTRKILFNVILNACETIKMSRLDNSRIMALTDIEGEEILKDALSQNRGVVGVCSHMGSFILMQAVLAKKGYPVNVLVRNPEGRHISEFLRRRQERLGISIISKKRLKMASDECTRWLANKGLLCLYLDQHAGNGARTEFFGKKVRVPLGGAVFARRFESPVIGIFSFRTSQNRNKIVIEGPYQLVKTDDIKHDTEYNTRIFINRIERFVREHPEQWFSWLHKRFR